MRRTRFSAAMLACLLLAAAFMTGCTALEASVPDVDARSAEEEPAETPEPTETPTATATPEETPEPSATALYNEYGTGDSEALFTNNTDFVFRSLQLQTPGAEEFGENLLESDAPIQQGDTFAVRYTADVPEVTPDPEEEILFSEDVYNIRLTTDSGEEYVLYENDLAAMDTAFISWDEEGDVLYLEFQSKLTGEVINTLESQLFMKDLMSGAIDETPADAAPAAAHSGSTGGPHSGSSGSGSSHTGSSSSGSSSGGTQAGGSSGGSGSGSADGGTSQGGSSGGNGGASDNDGGNGAEDEWSGGNAGSDDCLEDNIVWND